MIDNNKKAVMHIVKSQLGWDDDTYRDALRAHAGVSSVGDRKLGRAGFEKFMAHAEKCGFKNKNFKPKSSKKLLQGKIKKLQAELNLSAKYSNGIARNMFGIDNCAWCNAVQLRKIVAALMYHKKRIDAAHDEIKNIKK